MLGRTFVRMVSSEPQLVKTQLADGVFTITLNSPERRNCVGHPTAKALVAAFEQFEANKDAKVAVIHGAEVSEGGFRDIDPSFIEKYRFMGPTAMNLGKPLIAAVEGFAVAGGLELSLLADMRVAGRSAKFGVFCRRFGVPLIDGGTVRLPKVIGLGRALDLILTGREVNSDEAERIGLVNRVVDDGQALSEATKLASLIGKFPEQCMLADRRSVYNSLSSTYSEALSYEYKQGQSVLEEAIKGAGRFVNKKSKM